MGGYAFAASTVVPGGGGLPPTGPGGVRTAPTGDPSKTKAKKIIHEMKKQEDNDNKGTSVENIQKAQRVKDRAASSRARPPSRKESEKPKSSEDETESEKA